MAVNKDASIYFLIRLITYPCRWMPYSWIRKLGKFLGTICFYTMPQFRKRALSNLALAKELNLSRKEILRIAKESFHNLATVCLEYPKLDAEKKLSPHIFCENPEVADTIHAAGKGIIFFCGHLANWETLFLEGTTHMKGVAIGKPVQNKKLYEWIVSIRQKYGGKMMAPRHAVAQSLKALREGYFLGIVGDQGMPSSGYSSSFLGRNAWTSTIPALLSYKTNSPIIFTFPQRTQNGYKIHYSDPLWPDLSQPIEKETPRIMDHLLKLLEERIKKTPGDWLWQHNRWKQQTPKNIYKPFRQDSICLILPETKKEFDDIYAALPTLKEIYSIEFLGLIVPSAFRHLPLIDADEIIYYTKIQETLIDSLCYKLIFNFTDYQSIEPHFKNLSAIEVLNLSALKALAKPHLKADMQNDVSHILKRALCRPGSLWSPI
jgi:KDO2-lipid IV(A) lauroyltransferase